MFVGMKIGRFVIKLWNGHRIQTKMGEPIFLKR